MNKRQYDNLTKVPTFVSFEVKVVTNAGIAIEPVRCQTKDIRNAAAKVVQEKKEKMIEYNKSEYGTKHPVRIQRVEIVIPDDEINKFFGV